MFSARNSKFSNDFVWLCKTYIIYILVRVFSIRLLRNIYILLCINIHYTLNSSYFCARGADIVQMRGFAAKESGSTDGSYTFGLTVATFNLICGYPVQTHSLAPGSFFSYSIYPHQLGSSWMNLCFSHSRRNFCKQAVWQARLSSRWRLW